MDGGPKAYVHVVGAGDALRLSAGFGRLRDNNQSIPPQRPLA